MASTGEAFGLFWDSENGDRTYSASSFEYWLKKFFTSGVFNGDLQVKATSGMTLEVEAGYTNADGKVKFWNAPFNVTLDAANSTYPRIDTVVIRRDNVNRQITCEKVTGAYSGDTPQPTAPTRNSEIFELVIAQIYVGAGVTGITQSNITDTRPNNELCGYITGTVEELDFSAFTAQFEAYFAEFKRNQMVDFQAWEVAQQAAYAAWFSLVQQQQIQDKADWDAWYAALQEELHELPEDTAEYLQIEIDEIRTSGTTGSILKISTTETSLEGKTVTVTNGTETRTATFDENLECLIAGYKGTGEVTISSSDGIQTATTVVTIPYFGNYQYAIAFWAATVNIQGDDNLKGATITVKDSDNQTVDTVVLNVITGRGVFNAQKADTYTFNYTYQGTDYSESLVVDEETTYSLELNAGFSWQTWVTEGGLDPTDYEDLDELLEDEAALRRLFTVHASTDYICSLADVNADLEKIIYNDLCAKWINLRDYALDNMAANSAIKAVMDEADKYGYGEWALVGQVPKMTSNTAPYGEASASSSYSSSYLPWQAFDGNDSTWWADGYTTLGGYITYQFVNAICPVEIAWKSDNVKAIEVRGSNDNFSTYDVLGTCDNNNSNALNHFAINSDKNTYTSFRCVVTERMSGASDNDRNMMRTIQFYAWAPKGNVPIMTANNAPYGVASASSTYQSYNPYLAFDDSMASGWIANGGTNQWIQYKFTNPTCVKRMALLGKGTNRPKDFSISASNDGVTFTPLDSFDSLKDNEIEYFEIENTEYYTFYRITVATNYAASSSVYSAILFAQFYGRELSVSVPTMTGNTTPYGEASADSTGSTYYPWKAFNNSVSDGTYAWSSSNASCPHWLTYLFNKPTVVKFFYLRNRNNSSNCYAPLTFKIQGSNDEFVSDIHDITDVITSKNTAVNGVSYYPITNNSPYKAYRIYVVTSGSATTATPSNTTTIIQELQFFGLDYSEKEFETGTTKKWLYDHGVELETIEGLVRNSTDIITENEDSLEGYTPSGNGAFKWVTSNAIDLTQYSRAFAKHTTLDKQTSPSVAAVSIDTVKSWSLASDVAVAKTINNVKGKEVGVCVDISSINQSYYIGTIGSWYQDDGNVHCECTEAWLE